MGSVGVWGIPASDPRFQSGLLHSPGELRKLTNRQNTITMNIFQKDEVTLKELQQHLAVLDNLQDGEMVANVKTVANGTYPREGYRVDQNGFEYRWHNFLVCEGEVYDALAEEFGEETAISWETLYDAGLTSSQFERNLDREVPRGAKATATVQKQGEELNILTHELHIQDAATADRFDNEKRDQGTPLNDRAMTTNGAEEEMEPETA